MNAGATPKQQKSARLSNSAPNRDVAFNNRASRPSSPSMHPATTIATAAAPNRPSSAYRMLVNPAHSPSNVMMFGISLLNDGPEKRGRCRGLNRTFNRLTGEARPSITPAPPAPSRPRPSSAPPPPAAEPPPADKGPSGSRTG